MDESLYLREGFVVWIDDPLSEFHRIVRREPFDYETGEEDTAIFSTYAPGASTGFKTIAALEPDDKPPHLYQVYWGVADGNKYYIKIPAGQNRFGIDTDKEIGYVDCKKSPYYDKNPAFMFWLINEWYPSVSVTNISAMTITPKIWFEGMKYDIEPIVDDATIQAIRSGRIPHRRIFFGGVKNTP